MSIISIIRSLSGWFRVIFLLSIVISLYLFQIILEGPLYDEIYSSTVGYIKEQIPFSGVILTPLNKLLQWIGLSHVASFFVKSVFNFVLSILYIVVVYYFIALLESIRKKIVRSYYNIESGKRTNPERCKEIKTRLESTSEPSSSDIKPLDLSRGMSVFPPYIHNPSQRMTLKEAVKRLQDKLRIGIVLSGGGAKGAYQAGSMWAIYKFLKNNDALEHVRMISGTSIGTWNAMFWLTHNIANGVHRSWWHSVKPKRIIQPTYYIPFWNNYVLSSKPWQGYFAGLFTEEDYDKYIKTGSSSQKVHFYFTRTNVGSGSLEYHTNKPSRTKSSSVCQVNNINDVKEGVFMSMDLPPLFKRMEKDRKWFEDGGVIDNLPIRYATRDEGCNVLFVLPLNASFAEKVDHRSIFRRFMRIMDIRQGVLERDSIKNIGKYNELAAKQSSQVQHHHTVTPFIICPQEPLDIGTVEFWKTEEAGKAYDLAYWATKEELERFDFSPNYTDIWMALYSRNGEISYKKFD